MYNNPDFARYFRGVCIPDSTSFVFGWRFTYHLSRILVSLTKDYTLPHQYSSIATTAMTDTAVISQLLTALTQPNTEAIRAAEHALKPLLKDPRCVASLLTVLKSAATEQPAVRHVAAVVLRKRIGGHFKKFDAATKNYVKSEILVILSNEPERTVRHGAAGIAAEVAMIEIGR